MASNTRTAAQQAAYDRIMGDARTVAEQQRTGTTHMDDARTACGCTYPDDCDCAAIAADDAERARDDARAALSAAESAAEDTYMGSDEWYAVADAERALSAAERALSRARNALARAERPGDERAADARYAREAEHDRFMSTVRPAIYGQR
jgi:hypothetical protein